MTRETRRSPLSTSSTCPSAAAGWSRRRRTPSRTLPCRLWGYVLLEVDEEQHKAYDPSCDVRRDFDMAASVALGSGHKLLVRYNPDGFKIAGMTRRTTKKERHAQLIRLLGELLAREPEALFTRLFLFYDRAAENNTALCGGALVRARARRVPLRIIVPQRLKGWRVKYMGSKSWLAPHVDRLLGDVAVLHSPFFGSGKLEYYLATRRPPGGAWCRRLRARRKPCAPCCAWRGAR